MGRGAPRTDEGGAGGGWYGGGAASRSGGWPVLGLDLPADRYRAQYPSVQDRTRDRALEGGLGAY